jgi:hypothetical protein
MMIGRNSTDVSEYPFKVSYTFENSVFVTDSSRKTIEDIISWSKRNDVNGAWTYYRGITVYFYLREDADLFRMRFM